MKDIVKLGFTVDFNDLDKAITAYETKYQRDPILTMSSATAIAASSIAPPCNGDHDHCTEDCIIVLLEGYAIVTDEDMEFGEVELR